MKGKPMKKILVPALAFALGAAFAYFAAPRPAAGAPSGPKAVSAAKRNPPASRKDPKAVRPKAENPAPKDPVEETEEELDAIGSDVEALKEYAVSRTRASEDVQKAVVAALAERMPDTAEEMALFCRSRYADVAEEAVDELLNALDDAGPADAVRLLRTLMDASETRSSAEKAVDAVSYLDPRPAAACMSAILGSGGVYAETLARRFEDITGRAEATEEAVSEWLEEELSDD